MTVNLIENINDLVVVNFVKVVKGVLCDIMIMKDTSLKMDTIKTQKTKVVLMYIIKVVDIIIKVVKAIVDIYNLRA